MSATEALLEVTGLRVSYGGLVALDDVDLRIDPGSIVGLIGPNGAGKTTCIDTLAGSRRPVAGRIVFDGTDLEGVAPHQRARRGLVRTFQSLELFADLTVRENLVVGAGVPSWRATAADLFRVRSRRDDRVAEILDLLDLAAVVDARPPTLSNGQRHLVALGRALAMRPRLVLLDEPAAGLDPDETEALRQVLATLPARGLSVLLVDHDMTLVFGVCDTVQVLDFGRVIARGTPQQVRTDPAVVEAYLGTARPS